MSRLFLFALVIISLPLVAWQTYAQTSPTAQAPRDTLKPFMQRKLDHAKGVLEGLAIEDFELIAREAQALSLLSLESNWNVLTTEEYIQQSSDFRRAVNVISEAAREKDINRAALGYVNLTVRCVECHSYLRNQARRGETPSPAAK